jgi:hydrogenase-4 component F
MAIAGLPPSGMFIAEFALIRAGLAGGRWLTMTLVLILLTAAFIGVLTHLGRMLYGTPSPKIPAGEAARWPLIPLAICLAALVALGIVIPAPLEELVERIAESIAT